MLVAADDEGLRPRVTRASIQPLTGAARPDPDVACVGDAQAFGTVSVEKPSLFVVIVLREAPLERPVLVKLGHRQSAVRAAGITVIVVETSPTLSAAAYRAVAQQTSTRELRRRELTHTHTNVGRVILLDVENGRRRGRPNPDVPVAVDPHTFGGSRAEGQPLRAARDEVDIPKVGRVHTPLEAHGGCRPVRAAGYADKVGADTNGVSTSDTLVDGDV